MARLAIAVQWNSQSVKRDNSDVIFLLQNSLAVAAVFETWLRPGSHFRVPSFVCFRVDRSDGYGGAAIFIRNHTPFFPVGIPAHGDSLQAVTMNFEGTTFCADALFRAMLSVADNMLSATDSMFTLKKHSVVGIPSPPCMRRGHCSTPIRLAKLCIRDSSVYECALDDGDLNHIFLSCPLYDCHHLSKLSPRLW
ncbi:hypothetical protein EVAR_83792_1 [Eumeta japonica]|uniref:Uncharacterized protein n=1 Tax=Eumeta variegata TaxID=151549 RepID=A0A4C1WFI0_EUMVA|nr:hypothetical protein EVAR_83792_1 [Eumeta japonica]